MSRDMKQFVRDLGKIESVISNPQYLEDAGNLVLAAARLGAPAYTGNLRNKIFMTVEENYRGIAAHIGTNEEYAPFVEFGTGPKGMQNHKGISPNVTPTYTTTPWWVHESQIDPSTADHYHWRFIDTREGRFYQITGQAAQPFLYPALKDNEKQIAETLKGNWQDAIRKVTR